MNTFNIKLLALTLGFAFCSGAMAQSMSKTEYKDSKSRISAEYKADKTNCSTFSGNARDICVADAKGKERIAKAELDASYEPTIKNHYQVRIAKAEADYGVAKQKCDDLAGNVKDVCVKEARAARIDSKADALTQLTTARANAQASEASAEARSEAAATSGEARHDANAEKVNAQYQVDRAKCDAFSGVAKDDCLKRARLNIGS